MNIIKTIIKKLTPTPENLADAEITITAQYISNKIYRDMSDLSKEIAFLIAKDLYPQIKEKLLEPENFKFLINEIRLKIAKSFLEEK